MYYLYILQSQLDASYYIGSTSNIEKRLQEHNEGKSFYSSRKRPWLLCYQEIYSTRTEALQREKQIKRWKSRKMIQILISKKVV